MYNKQEKVTRQTQEVDNFEESKYLDRSSEFRQTRGRNYIRDSDVFGSSSSFVSKQESEIEEANNVCAEEDSEEGSFEKTYGDKRLADLKSELADENNDALSIT